jgi:hypothetical protein
MRAVWVNGRDLQLGQILQVGLKQKSCGRT